MFLRILTVLFVIAMSSIMAFSFAVEPTPHNSPGSANDPDPTPTATPRERTRTVSISIDVTGNPPRGAKLMVGGGRDSKVVSINRRSKRAVVTLRGIPYGEIAHIVISKIPYRNEDDRENCVIGEEGLRFNCKFNW